MPARHRGPCRGCAGEGAPRGGRQWSARV